MTVLVFAAFHVLPHIHIRAGARSGNRGGFNNDRFWCVYLSGVKGFNRFLPYPLFSRAVSVFTYTARDIEKPGSERLDATNNGGSPYEQ